MSRLEDNAEEAEAFLRKHVKMLKRHLIGRGIAADLADESITDTFLVVERKWKQVETLDEPEAWTRLVALRIARKKQQRRRSWEARHTALVAAVSEEDITLQIANHELLWQALQKLPEKQKIAIVLRYYEQFSVAESANIMNVSPGTITSNTFDGLRNLRRILDAGNARREEDR